MTDEVVRDVRNGGYPDLTSVGYSIYNLTIGEIRDFTFKERGANYYKAIVEVYVTADSVELPQSVNPIQALIYSFSNFTHTPTTTKIETYDSGDITFNETYPSNNQGWDFTSVSYAIAASAQGTLDNRVYSITSANDPLGVTGTLNYEFGSDNAVTTSITDTVAFERIRSLRFGSSTATSWTENDLENLSNFGIMFGTENPVGNTITINPGLNEYPYIMFDEAYSISEIVGPLGLNEISSFTMTEVGGFKIYRLTDEIPYAGLNINLHTRIMANFFNISGGLRILNDSPVDSRIVADDEAARFAIPSAVVYEGLIVYQKDNNHVYVLEDISEANNADGWDNITSNSHESFSLSAKKANGYYDLTVTLEDGTTDTIVDAWRDGYDIVSGSVTDGILTLVDSGSNDIVVSGDLTGPQGPQGSFRFTVYQNATSGSSPDRPDPTDYTLAEDLSLTNGIPSGWSLNPASPVTGQSTYAITALVDPRNDDPDNDGIVSLVWSNTFIAGSTGPSGPAGVSIIDANVPEDGANEGHLVLTRDQSQPDIITDGIVAGDKNLEMVQVAGQVFFRGERGDGTAFENGPFDFAGVGSDETITEWDRLALYDVGHVVFEADATSIQLYRWNDVTEEAGVALTDSRWDKVLDTNDLATDTELALKIDKPTGTPGDQGFAGHFISVDSSGNTNSYNNDTIHLSDAGAIEVAREFIVRPSGVDGDAVVDITTANTTIYNDVKINGDLAIRADDATDILVATSGADLANSIINYKGSEIANATDLAGKQDNIDAILADATTAQAADNVIELGFYSDVAGTPVEEHTQPFAIKGIHGIGLNLGTQQGTTGLHFDVEISGESLVPHYPFLPHTDGDDPVHHNTVDGIQIFAFVLQETYTESADGVEYERGLYLWNSDNSTWETQGVTISNLGAGTTQDPLKIPGMLIYDQVNDRYYIENNGNAFGRFVSFNAYAVGDRVLHDQVLYECIEAVDASATGANLNPSTNIFLSTQRPGSTQAGQISTTNWRYIAGPVQRFNAGDSYLKGSEIDFEYLGAKHIYTTLFSLNGTDTTGDANNPERRSYRLPGDTNADNVWYEHLLGGLDGVGDHQTREFPAVHPGDGFFIPVGSFWNWLGQKWEFNGPDPQGTSHPTGTLYPVPSYDGNSPNIDPKTGVAAKHFPPNLYSGLWTRSHDETIWGPFNAYTQGEQVTFNVGTIANPDWRQYILQGADKAFISSTSPNNPPNHTDESDNWIEVVGGGTPFNPTEYDPTQVYQTGAFVTSDGELFQCTATTTAQPGNSTIETEGDNWRSITETLASVDSVATFPLLTPDNSIIRVGEIMCVINDPSPYNNGLYRVISHNAGGTSVARIDELNHLHEIVEGLVQHSGSSASFEFPDDNPAFITGTLVDETKFTTVEGTKSTTIPSLDTVAPKFEPPNGRMTLVYNNLSDEQITQLEAAVGSDLAFRTTAGGVVTAGNVEDTNNAVPAQSTYHFLLKSVNYRLGTGRRQLNFVMRDLSQATDFVSAFSFEQNTGLTGNAGNLYIPTDGPLVTNLIDNIALVNIVAISGGGGGSLTSAQQIVVDDLVGLTDNAFAQKSGTGIAGGLVVTGVELGSHIGELRVTTNNNGVAAVNDIGVDHIVFSDDTTDWNGEGIPDDSFGMDGQLALSNFASAAYIKRNGSWSTYIFPSAVNSTTFGDLSTVIDQALTDNASETVMQTTIANQNMAIRGNGTGQVILQGVRDINGVSAYKALIPTILLGTRGVATEPATVSGVDNVTIQSFTRGTSVNYLFTGIEIVDETTTSLTYQEGRALVANTDDLTTATQIANLIG